MSLIVFPYKRDSSTGAIEKLAEQPQAPFNDLFGPEIWRIIVWSAPCLKQLDCTLLNTLATRDLYLEQEDLPKLKKEIEQIKANEVFITAKLTVPFSTLNFRLNNALEAIRIALEQEGRGVYIG